MKEKKGKILGTLLFLLLILSLIYLTFFIEKKSDKRRVDVIEIKNNNLLPGKDYLDYCRLNDKNIYSTLTLSVIKSRIEKHPYVSNAEVEFRGMKNVSVIINEKNIRALLLGGNEPYLITGNYQVLPLLPNTKFIDVTMISNPENAANIKPFYFLKSGSVKEAFKIIEAAELIDEKMMKNISEINLRNGGDILLTISGMPSSVIFGRKDESRKITYLKKIYDLNAEGNNIAEGSSYIDLRFDNHVYFGGYQNTGFIE